MTSNPQQFIELSRPMCAPILNAIISFATHPILRSSQNTLVRIAALALLALALTLSGTFHPQPDSPC